MEADNLEINRVLLLSVGRQIVDRGYVEVGGRSVIKWLLVGTMVPT